MAREVRDQLIKGGKVHRGQLGVSIQPVTQELATALGLKDTDGVLIGDVTPDSPAARAGVKRGDVIRKVDNDTVHNPNALRNKIALNRTGTEVTLRSFAMGKNNK